MSRGYLARTVVNRMSKIFLDFLARVSRFWRAFYTCGLQSSWQRRIDVVKPGRTSEKSTSIRPHIMSTCLVAPTARHCSIGTAFRRRQNLSSRKFQIRKRNSRCQASDHPAGTVSTSVEQFTDGTEDAVEISALQSSLSAEDNSAAEDDSTIEVGSSADDSTTEVVSSTCAGCSDNSKVAKAGDKRRFTILRRQRTTSRHRPGFQSPTPKTISLHVPRSQFYPRSSLTMASFLILGIPKPTPGFSPRWTIRISFQS